MELLFSDSSSEVSHVHILTFISAPESREICFDTGERLARLTATYQADRRQRLCPHQSRWQFNESNIILIIRSIKCRMNVVSVGHK